MSVTNKILFILLLLIGLTKAKEWDASSYPNPTSSGYRQCNMKSSASLCDPDNVLSESDRYRLNYELNQLEGRTRQTQSDNFCAKKGIVAAVAIARKVRGGSENAVKVMANDMLSKWTLDKQCAKSLVIVVSVEDRKFWVARDSRVPVYATEFTDLFNAQKPLFKEGNYLQALLNVIDGTKDKTLSKQASAPDDGNSRGTLQPSGPQRPNRNGNIDFNPFAILTKIPLWMWLGLILIVLPLLCCCCCLYLCCCRKKGSDETNNKRQNPTDENPATRRDGGGNMLNGMISGISGAAIMNVVSGCLKSQNSGQRNRPHANDNPYRPTSTADYEPGGYQQRGRGLYPSVVVKDEGGGGQW